MSELFELNIIFYKRGYKNKLGKKSLKRKKPEKTGMVSTPFIRTGESNWNICVDCNLGTL